jgi:uncharacterized protein YjbI with pentapeptide repeats
VKTNAQSANMTMTILYHAVLDDADLREARLHNAVLIGARGRGTIFTKADLTGIYAPAVALHRSSFNESQLEGANLVTADLRASTFNHANLTHANLQEANLQDASFPGADLTAARLDGADVRHTVFHGTNLSGALGLTQAQLDSACADEFTKLPPSLIRPAPCTPSKKARRR